MKEPRIPANKDAEYGVLGSVFIDPQVLDDVILTLHPDDFYSEVHRNIYKAMLVLVGKRQACDSITVIDELERSGIAAPTDTSWYGYITEIINYVPTASNALFYANIVQRAAMNRQLISVAGQIATLAYNQDEQSLELAEQLLSAIRRGGTQHPFAGMPELVSEYMENLNYLYENRGTYSGVPTGYRDLDVCLASMQRSDLILLAARPSIGKTAFSLCIALNAASLGFKVAYFSLEMGKRSLTGRLMAMRSQIDMQRLRGGWIEDDEWEKIEKAAGSLSPLPLWINDTAGNPISSMKQQLRDLAKDGKPTDLIVVDYVGLIGSEADMVKQQTVQQISAISRDLKQLAREQDVPVLALCQLSRKLEDRQNKRPQLADLRDSGSLEQDADVVLFIYRDDVYKKDLEGYEPTNIAEIIIAKQRNGPTGEISLYYEAQQAAFYPLEVQIGEMRGDE